MYLAGKDNKMNKPNSRARRTMNDDIKTNPIFAKKVIDYFSPQFKKSDTFMEPCRGDGAFYDNLPELKDWCEIDEGKDFLEYDCKCDWIITNFPWSGKILRPLVRKACNVSNNVVHLIRCHNVIGTVARHKDFLNEGHTIKEIIIVPWQDTFINKANEGFALMVTHTKKNYKGDCKWTYWI